MLAAAFLTCTDNEVMSCQGNFLVVVVVTAQRRIAFALLIMAYPRTVSGAHLITTTSALIFFFFNNFSISILYYLNRY